MTHGLVRHLGELAPERPVPGQADREVLDEFVEGEVARVAGRPCVGASSAIFLGVFGTTVMFPSQKITQVTIGKSKS